MAKGKVKSKKAISIKTKKAFRLYVICFVLASFILAIVLISNPKSQKIDWLSNSDWSHFTGAEQVDYSVNFYPTGRVINHKDTSTAQPNPPVNVRGSHLKISNSFRIDTSISGIDNTSIMQFYGEVPVIYDEWRQERGSIRITTNNFGVIVKIWDGSASSSIDERTFEFNIKNTTDISLLHDDKNITIFANGRKLGSIPNHNIFGKGTVWFGSDALENTEGWTLNSLTARGIDDGTVEVINAPVVDKNFTDSSSLKTLAANHPRKLPIGTAVSFNMLFSDDQYRKIAISQFNMMTPENSLKPQFIHPKQDLYAFEDVDSLVEVAQKNNMIVHGHSLVMGKANPEWMQKIPKTESKQVMIDHITNVISHYKGKIAQWDVVNEPMSEDTLDYKTKQLGIRKQLWFDAMGEEYIDIAYRAARAADPKAKLYINDFGLEKKGERWEAFVSLIKRLQSRGVPLDGVGFESHVYHSPSDNIDPSVLKQHIQELAALGLVSRISEIDVLGDNQDFQANQYSSLLQVCLSEPTCTSYGVWGITDLYGSTTLADRYPVVLGDSLLWDTDFTPKPALKSLQDVLKNS